MGKIYGQANRVIVYLGEDDENSQQALEDIRAIAEDESKNALIGEKRKESIVRFLQRPWFRRIWVLQEVGLARRILIVCGSMEINGHAFSLGLSRLKPLDHVRQDWRSLIGAATYLIRRAIFRPKYSTSPSDRISLGELMDMYHVHEATVRQDKVYALLGMSSDDIHAAGLLPDYSVPWENLLQRLVQFILSKDTSIETWAEREIVVIRSKGYALGHVSSVHSADNVEYDRQHITVVLNNAPASYEYRRRYSDRWTLRVSAKSVQKHDIICVLQGASKPTIIRQCKDHFAIIIIAVTPQERTRSTEDREPAVETRSYSHNFLLVWNWGQSREYVEDLAEFESPAEINTLVPEYSETASDKAVGSCDLALVLIDSGHINGEWRMQTAIKDCEKQFGKEDPRTLAGIDSLALSYQSRGDWSRAANLFVQLIQTRKSVQGVDHPDMLDSLANLASIYIAKEGLSRYQEKPIVDLANRIRDNSQIPEEQIIQAVKLYNKELIALLFDLYGDNLSVTHELLEAAAENTGKNNEEVILLLLNLRGAEVKITEKVVKAAARNLFNGETIIAELLNYYSFEFKITEEVLKAAAANTRKGEDILALFFDRCGADLKITEEVLKVAAANISNGEEVMTQLLSHRSAEVKVTEEVLKVAAANTSIGQEIMAQLLSYHDAEFKITEEVFKLAVANTGSGKEIIAQLLDYQNAEGKITEEVLKAAAANEYRGEDIMVQLLKYPGTEANVTEEVLKAAAANEAIMGKEIMAQLLNSHNAEVNITEEVLKAAAANKGKVGKEIAAQLLNYQSAEVKVTEEVLKAAAANEDNGEEIMKYFLDCCGADLKITEEVVKAAARNRWLGGKLLSLLVDRGGNEVKITEGVLREAVSNENQGFHLVEFLHEKFSFKVTPGVIEAAATSGNEGVLELFDEWGEMSSNKDKWFDILDLYNAVNSGNEATVHQLIAKGTPPNKRNIRGKGLLWYASSSGHTKVVEILLATGAVNVNAKTTDGTALFWAAACGYFEVVRLLLEHGADPNYVHEDGETARSQAELYHFTKVLALLDEHESALKSKQAKNSPTSDYTS